MQAGRSTSPTTAPGVITPWSSRWPTPPSRCSWSIAAAIARRTRWPPASSTGPSACAARPASARSLLRGDTDFTQTAHLDRWDDAGDIRFLFGIDARPNLIECWPSGCRRRPTATWNARCSRSRPRRGTTRAAQGGDRPRAGLRDDPYAGGDGRGVRLPADGLRPRVPGDRAAQAAGDRQGADAAVRGIPLLLLHHQRPHDAGRRGGPRGQRAVRPGEPDLAAQDRRPRA